MSLKDKASRINFSGLPGVTPAPAAVAAEGEVRRPRTAPGAMMEFAQGQRSELLRENDELRAKAEKAEELRARLDEALGDLKAWDGAKAARLLDPALVRHSRFANRDSRSFATADFADLKAEIASAGGNVQPIKVRPIADGAFEVVFGHRRLQACRDLGLPVLALVDSIDDQALFVEMDRENRGRKDLSPWEQGVMYRRALAEGLFPSNRKLAEAVGVDLGAVGKALSLADLPQEVIEAFPSPLEIQFRWAKPLKDAIEADANGVIARAKKVKTESPSAAAKEIFERLVAVQGRGVEPFNPPAPVEMMVEGKKIGVISFNSKGAATVVLEPGLLTPAKVAGLQKVIEAFVKGK